MSSFARCVLIAGLITLLGMACAPNLPSRRILPGPKGDYPLGPHEKAASPEERSRAFAIETNNSYKLGFVEFDDQGWFWGHRQWEAVKQSIWSEATNNHYGIVILVFVHGWKNNADYANGNVELFRGVLARMHESLAAEDRANGVPPRKLFGVYAGWRGMSATVEPFKELSFYNRKAVAERIGHQGAATQVFTELEIMQQEFNQHRTNVPPAKLIFIGHSFGGALLFSATSQIMTEHLVLGTQAQGREPVRVLGDLVILLNPAFEASLYNNLISLAVSPDMKYPPNQRPILAIFTSKTDTATKKWFPRGRRLSTIFEKTRRGDEGDLFNVPKQSPPNQKEAIVKTIGNDGAYVTYDLWYSNHLTTLAQAAQPLTATTTNLHQLREAWTTNSFNVTNATPYYFPNRNGTNEYVCVLAPRRGRQDAPFASKEGNPFLNVSVDPAIMDGHSDISNSNLVTFLQQFILFAQTNYAAADLNARR